jgi:hypothetical protein
METFDAFVFPDLSGAVLVHDRYQNYDAIPGVLHQLCCAHILRDLEDAAQAYPDAIWPGQAADALRGLIHAANTARARGLAAAGTEDTASDLRLFRNAVRVGLIRGPPGSRREHQTAARAAAAGMPGQARTRHPALPQRPAHPAHVQPGRTRPAARENPAEDLRPPPLRDRRPPPVRRPRLHLHRRKTRRGHHHRHPRRARREPLDAARPRSRRSHSRHPARADRPASPAGRTRHRVRAGPRRALERGSHRAARRRTKDRWSGRPEPSWH